MARPVDF